MIYLNCFIYLIVIVLANLVITHLGPSYIGWVAFFLIPIDFIIRDYLQEEWKGSYSVFLKMGALIIIGSSLTFLLNNASLKIGIASCAAFFSAGIIDTIVYSILINRPKLVKVNISNIFAAIVDSILFIYLAFGLLDFGLMAKQASIKGLGSLFWTLLVFRIFGRIRKKGP